MKDLQTLKMMMLKILINKLMLRGYHNFSLKAVKQLVMESKRDKNI
jgi:hypothetical protein